MSENCVRQHRNLHRTCLTRDTPRDRCVETSANPPVSRETPARYEGAFTPFFRLYRIYPFPIGETRDNFRAYPEQSPRRAAIRRTLRIHGRDIKVGCAPAFSRVHCGSISIWFVVFYCTRAGLGGASFSHSLWKTPAKHACELVHGEAGLGQCLERIRVCTGRNSALWRSLLWPVAFERIGAPLLGARFMALLFSPDSDVGAGVELRPRSPTFPCSPANKCSPMAPKQVFQGTPQGTCANSRTRASRSCMQIQALNPMRSVTRHLNRHLSQRTFRTENL
jgi:hypothetical protein